MTLDILTITDFIRGFQSDSNLVRPAIKSSSRTQKMK